MGDQFQTEPLTNLNENPSRGGGFTPRGTARGFNQNANESNPRGGFEPGQRGGRGSFGSSPGFGRGSFNENHSPSQNSSTVGGPQNQNQRSGIAPGTVKEEPKNVAPVKVERANRVSRFGPPVTAESSLVDEKNVQSSSLNSLSKIDCAPCNAQFTNSISYR